MTAVSAGCAQLAGARTMSMLCLFDMDTDEEERGVRDPTTHNSVEGLTPLLEHCSSSGSDSDFFDELACAGDFGKPHFFSTSSNPPLVTAQLMDTDPVPPSQLHLQIPPPWGGEPGGSHNAMGVQLPSPHTESILESTSSETPSSDTPRSASSWHMPAGGGGVAAPQQGGSTASSPPQVVQPKLEECGTPRGDESPPPGSYYTLANLPLPPPVNFPVPSTAGLDMPLPEISLPQAMLMVAECRIPGCMGVLCNGHRATKYPRGVGATVEVVQKNVGALQALLPLLAPGNGANSHQRAVALSGIHTIVQRLAATTKDVELPKQVVSPSELEERNMELEDEVRVLRMQLRQREDQLKDVQEGLSAMRRGLMGLQSIGVL